MNRPEPITVVIPFCNHIRWVGEAYDSVLAQTLPPDEIILIDNHATDGSREMLEAKAARSAIPTRLIRVEGETGPWQGRLLGAREARTPLVAFCDADDLFRPEKLAVQSDALAQCPESVLATAPVAPFPDEPGLPYDIPSRWPQPPGIIRPPALLARVLFDLNTIVSTSVPLIRREPLLERIADAPALTGIDDQVLWGSLALDCAFLFIEQPLVDYRVRRGSITLTESRDRFFDKMMIYLDFLWVTLRKRRSSIVNADRIEQILFAAMEEYLLQRTDEAAPGSIFRRRLHIIRLLGNPTVYPDLGGAHLVRMAACLIPGVASARRRGKRIRRFVFGS